MPPTDSVDEQWLSAREGGRRLARAVGLPEARFRPEQFQAVARAAGVRMLVFPGRHPRYSARDVARIAASAVQVCGDEVMS